MIREKMNDFTKINSLVVRNTLPIPNELKIVYDLKIKLAIEASIKIFNKYVNKDLFFSSLLITYFSNRQKH